MMKQHTNRKRITIILTVLILTFTYVFYIPSLKQVPEKMDDQIRVMSYNLRYGSEEDERWPERRDLIVAQIQSYEPDILGVQEANWHWMHSEDNLPNLLEGYDHVGVGRDDGNASGEYAAIFYKESTLALIDSGNFWLSETPQIPSLGWDAGNIRICTWAIFNERSSGKKFIHYNTHLDHEGEVARRESLQLILKTIESQDYPVILTGDFNFLQGTQSYKNLQNSDRLIDSKYATKDRVSHGSINWFLPINFQWMPPIDFCFVSSNDWEVMTYRVDNSYRLQGRPVSDHFPLVVDMVLK